MYVLDSPTKRILLIHYDVYTCCGNQQVVILPLSEMNQPAYFFLGHRIWPIFFSLPYFLSLFN